MLFLFGFALFSLAWGQSCYFPDGSLSPNDQPCPRADGASDAPCCGTQLDGSRAICLSNNLCMSDLKISRGSCTDRSWNAFACPHYCLEVSALNTGLVLQSCDGANLWSCNECSVSNFTLQEGLFRFSPTQLAELSVAGFANQNTTTSSTSTSPSPSASTSSSTSTSTSTSQSSTGAGTNPSPVESSTASSSPDNVTCSTASKTGTNATVVGAAVGVSLGAALLTVAALLINERRKNIQLRHQLGPGPMRAQNQVPILSSPTSTIGLDKPLPLFVSPYNKPPPPPPPPPGYRSDNNSTPRSGVPSGDRWRPFQRSQIMGQNSNHRSGVALVNELDGSSPSEMASPVDYNR